MKNLLYFLILSSIIHAISFASIHGELIDVQWHSVPEIKSTILQNAFELKIGDQVDSMKIVNALQKFINKLNITNYPIAQIDSAIWVQEEYGGILQIYLSQLLPLHIDTIKVNGDTSLNFTNIKKQPFHSNQFDLIIKKWYEKKLSDAQPFAYVTLDSGVIQQDEDKITIRLNATADTSHTVFLTDVMIANGGRIKQEYWRRETRLKFPSKFSLNKVNRAKKYLQTTELFSNVGDYELVKYGSDYFLYFSNRMLPPTRLDGIVGYIPATTRQKGFITGTIELSFYQLFQSFRKLYFKWNKPNRGNQSLVLSYQEPWLFQYPIAGEFAFQSMIRDTLYSEFRTSIFFNWQYNEFWTVRLGFSIREIVIDSMYQRVSGIQYTKGNEYNIRVSYDAQDDWINPTNGLKFHFDWQRAFHKTSESNSIKYYVYKLDYQLEQITKLFHNTLLMVGWKGGDIQSNRTQLPIFELYRIGGPEYVRGYLPEQFLAQKFGIFTVEPRWLFGKQTRTYLLSDVGYFFYPSFIQKKTEFVWGNGIGMLVGFQSNSVGVTVAWNRYDTPLNGKISFQLNQRF
ncbi:MAG: BamA/TamA family outer membrane protein [bacterium]|nr:BamA/TamA family outer membrane protein [bacterium]